MSTKAISLKLPIELHERLKAEAEAAGTTVTALLIEGVSGAAKPDPRVAELEAALATMTKDRDQWRDRAKAIVDAKQQPTSNAESRRLARQHAAGPVKASAVPDVAGTVPWCGLKGIDKARKAG